MSEPLETAKLHAPIFHFHQKEGDFCCFPSSAEVAYSLIGQNAKTFDRIPKTLERTTPCYFEYFPATGDKPERIRYWLWYNFNDFPMPRENDLPVLKEIGNHAGDWESVIVCLRDGRPSQYLLSSHRTARSVTPESADHSDDGRIEVWVALGSHSNYESVNPQRQLPDQLSNDGETFDSRDSLVAVSETTFAAVRFAGDWSLNTNFGGPIVGPPMRPISQYDALLLKPAGAHEDFHMPTLQEAIQTALGGTEVYPLVHNGHKFHLKPIILVKTDNGKGATGVLDHDVRGPDTRVTFKISCPKGGATKTEVQWGNDWREKIPGMPPDDGSSWKASAGGIIDTIALTIELS